MESSTTEESTTAHQPGKSWIVLEEDDGNGLGLPLLMATGGLAVLGIVAITVYKMCRKIPEEEVADEDYSVAVSNSMFRDDRQLSLKEMPCLNCRLIEMGEMACYTDRCSQCGRVPPGRKAPTKISQKRVGGVGVSTTNSMATRQQPPPQYSTTPMEQEYPGQQGQQYQAGYPVDPRLHEQGQYRSQYQGRGQPRSQYQQQGV